MSTSLRPPSRRFAVGTAATLGAVGVGVLAFAHWIGQYTAAGRRFDGAAQEALIDPSWRVQLALLRALGLVTTPSLAVVLVILVLWAAARRRWWTALAVAVLVGGATVSSQALKYGVLERPDIPAGGDNSLPSGHATIAGAVGLALLLVVTARCRSRTAGLAAFLAAGGGLATVWGGTHRPVDVLGAIGVCAVWAALAVVLARRDERCAPKAPRPCGDPWPAPGRRGNGFGWAALGALVPVWAVVFRLGLVHPRGALEGALAALALGALVVVTVTLTVRALEPPPADGHRGDGTWGTALPSDGRRAGQGRSHGRPGS